MPELEVCSPVTRKGSKVGSGQPMSPGARSMPTDRRDSVPPQPMHRGATHAEEPGGTVQVTGPEE
jgi:hypothetical protein